MPARTGGFGRRASTSSAAHDRASQSSDAAQRGEGAQRRAGSPLRRSSARRPARRSRAPLGRTAARAAPPPLWHMSNAIAAPRPARARDPRPRVEAGEVELRSPPDRRGACAAAIGCAARLAGANCSGSRVGRCIVGCGRAHRILALGASALSPTQTAAPSAGLRPLPHTMSSNQLDNKSTRLVGPVLGADERAGEALHRERRLRPAAVAADIARQPGACRDARRAGHHQRAGPRSTRARPGGDRRRDRGRRASSGSSSWKTCT